MARTTRVPDQYASAGAVRQAGGLLPVYTCNACKAEVAWCKSARTGRPYLVTVRRGYLDQRFYMGNDVHVCTTPAPAPKTFAQLKAETLAE